MNAFIQSSKPLSNEQIISQLRQLRAHCFVESSHFAVTALLEFKIEEQLYAYISGVNVENAEHNRLSMHAEQNALATAQTLLGDQARFSRAWVMAAPDHLKADTQEENYPVTPCCGHCRQILLSFATPKATIYTVTLQGKISEGFQLDNLLPLAFSESDLQVSQEAMNPALKAPQQEPWLLLKERSELSTAALLGYLRSLAPHIINPAFTTSPLRACILKLANHPYYAPGVLVQDIAFLTTDAVFTALGHAITQFGAKNLSFAAIYLYGDSLEMPLSGGEIQALRPFIEHDLLIQIFTVEGKSRTTRFSDCVQDLQTRLCAW